MLGIDIAVEMGSAYTSIYLGGTGTVLYEPSMASFVDTVSMGSFQAAGAEVKQMLGKTPERVITVLPVTAGIVTDKVAAAAMMKSFVKRAVPAKLFRSIRALVTIPCGLTVEEKQSYEDVLLKSGVSEVVLVESIIAAAVGAGLPIESAKGLLIADIGGGTTDIAVISMGGIISGCSINAGGIIMDEAISDMVSEKYGLKIGPLTAEKLKNETGSLFENDLAEAKVNGMGVNSGTPSAASVTAADILKAVKPYYLKIVETIESVIEVCPPEVASDIYEGGLHLTGGCACMAGVEMLIGSTIKLAVRVAPNAEHSVILGAAKLLTDEELLNTVFEHN